MVFPSRPHKSGRNLGCKRLLPEATSSLVPPILSHLASCFQRLDPNSHVASVLQPVQVMGDRLDLRIAKGRMSFLLSLVQAYRLLAVLSAAVPQLPGRWPLYSEIERENSMYVSCMTQCCASAGQALARHVAACAYSDQSQHPMQLSAYRKLYIAWCCTDTSIMQLACCQCKTVTLSLSKYKHGFFPICHVTIVWLTQTAHGGYNCSQADRELQKV